MKKQCNFCNKQIYEYCYDSHVNKCEKLTQIRICKCCKKEFTNRISDCCSASCGTTLGNTGRKKSLESKQKIGKSLQKFCKRISTVHICKKCNCEFEVRSLTRKNIDFCTQKCKRLSQEKVLKEKERIFSSFKKEERKLLKCRHCDSEFDDDLNLRQHEIFCDKEEVVCEICEKTFTSKSSFTDHKKWFSVKGREKTHTKNNNRAVNQKIRDVLTKKALEKFGCLTQTNTCVTCKCEFEVSVRNSKSRNKKFCSRICSNVRHKMSEEQKNKISLTMRTKLKTYSKGIGFGKHGSYKGIHCDSSWELAWVMYNINNEIKFDRCHDHFEYEFEGVVRNYYPDFVLPDGTYVEIKGREDEKWRAKELQFPKDKSLQILRGKEMSPILKYVKKKWGQNFTDLFDDKQ